MTTAPPFAPARVVLIGFMASGKTVVGRRLAQRLGWRHVDVDREIEKEEGLPIESIFAQRGEVGFRELEVRITPSISKLDRTVISTGGGWITNPGLFDGLPQDTLTVWLKVSLEEVLRRVAASGDRPVRPLLRGADPPGRLRDLLRSREPLYARAAVVIETEGRSVPEVVDTLERLVRGNRSAPHSQSSSSQNGS